MGSEGVGRENQDTAPWGDGTEVMCSEVDMIVRLGDQETLSIGDQKTWEAGSSEEENQGTAPIGDRRKLVSWVLGGRGYSDASIMGDCFSLGQKNLGS